MKSIVFSVLTFLVSLDVFSQSLFDKYLEKEDVEVVEVSQKMFEMFSKIEATDKETQEFMQIAKKLSGLRFFTTQNKTIASQMKSDVETYRRSTSLQEFMRAKDKSGDVRFYVREGKDTDHFSELIMFANEHLSTSTVLLTITGNISVEDLNVLAKKMNLPEELTEIK